MTMFHSYVKLEDGKSQASNGLNSILDSGATPGRLKRPSHVLSLSKTLRQSNISHRLAQQVGT